MHVSASCSNSGTRMNAGGSGTARCAEVNANAASVGSRFNQGIDGSTRDEPHVVRVRVDN